MTCLIEYYYWYCFDILWVWIYLHNVLEFGINDVEIHYLWRHIIYFSWNRLKLFEYLRIYWRKNSSENCLTGNEHHESWFTWYRFSWKTRNSFELPKLVLGEVWINPGVQLFWKWCNMPQLPVYNFGLNRFMCVWTL